MTHELKYVLDKIKNHEIFIKNDFRLVGGTALSYHINHRLSEDLDFFLLKKLPRDDVDDFIEFCVETFGEKNVKPIPLSNSAIYDFEINCEDINDYQQDWNINSVKVTFAECSDNVGLKDILGNDKFILDGNVKISSTDAIFKMKSLMFYKRVKSRDYFDLLTLYEKGFSPKDTIELIRNYELAYQDRGIELFYLKLSQQVYKKEFDEPLTGLTKDVKSFEDMKKELISKINPNF